MTERGKDVKPGGIRCSSCGRPTTSNTGRCSQCDPVYRRA